MAVKKAPTSTPTVKRVTPIAPAVAATGGRGVKLDAFTLPTAATRPAVTFRDLTWLIYGQKGIGKTSLAARFDGALVAPFEPGTKFLDIPRLPVITRWEEMLRVVEQLVAGGHEYSTLVIDPGNKAYDCAMDYVCAREGVTHPSDRNDFGKTWKKVSAEFQTAHLRLAAAGVSAVILAHDKTMELETMSGQVFSRVVPVMSGATEEYYAGVVDMIGYYHYYKRERYLQIRGDDYVMAKCRPEQHFLTPGGEPVVRIPMGRTSTQAIAAVMTAFNNKQRETYAELTGVTSQGGDDAPLSRKQFKMHKRAKGE